MSKAGSRILQGAREALAFASGEAGASDYGVHIPPQVDVRAIRRQTGLSQKEFAARYGFSFGRIRDWEQGRRSMLPRVSFSRSSATNLKPLSGRCRQHSGTSPLP